MKFFKKAKKNVENTFDGDHLKEDVENGRLERGSIIWGFRSATIGVKEIVKEVVGRTVTVANTERDKRIGEDDQKEYKLNEKATTEQDVDLDEMQEFEEWKRFQAFKRKNK